MVTGAEKVSGKKDVRPTSACSRPADRGVFSPAALRFLGYCGEHCETWRWLMRKSLGGTLFTVSKGDYYDGRSENVHY
jgi:hypothetical protein